MGELQKFAIEIDGETAEAVEFALATGDYRQAQDVFREAMRLWKDSRSSEAEQVRELWAERTRSDRWLEGNFTLDEIRGATD